MKGSFAATRLDEIAPWVAGPMGVALQTAFGDDQNAAVGQLEDTAKMMSPFLCPDDALDALGRRFAMPRFPNEPNGTAPLPPSTVGSGYRGRLCSAWLIKLGQGTAGGIVEELQAYGLPDVVVYEAHDLAFLPASPINYSPAFSPPWYSAFLTVIGPDFGATGIGPQLAPFVPGPQCTSGSTATRDQVRAICGIILEQTMVGGYPVGVLLRFGTTALGGINTLAPFTPSPTPQFCFWNIGKLMGVNIFTGPFVAGGYAY